MKTTIKDLKEMILILENEIILNMDREEPFEVDLSTISIINSPSTGELIGKVIY